MSEEQKCRVCGCTENNACVSPYSGACYWVEDDLCSACCIVTLSHEYVNSLSVLVTWFRDMITKRNIGTSGLTAAYCDELLVALHPSNNNASDIVNGKATRDIKAGEAITIDVSELRRLENE